MNAVVLVDAGTGNLRSVQKALESLGASVQRTDDPEAVRAGERVILPGVGAFGDFMDGLRARRLEPVIKEVAERGTPLLGICVGMQALFEVGEEMGQHPGLGLLPGRAVCFPGQPGLKVPHTGWNQLEVRKGAALFDEISSGAYVYFNHSFYCLPEESSDILATTDYGFQYASAVQRGNIQGVQFHPEKSQKVGLRLLRSFLEAA